MRKPGQSVYVFLGSRPLHYFHKDVQQTLDPSSRLPSWLGRGTMTHCVLHILTSKDLFQSLEDAAPLLESEDNMKWFLFIINSFCRSSLVILLP